MTNKNKFNKAHLAVGLWSSPNRLIKTLQIPERIRVMQQDQLILLGRVVSLYLPVAWDSPGVVPCTCKKDTTNNSERLCITCFGTGYSPGYERFLHQTIHFSSSEASNFTLTNTEVSTLKKVNTIALSAGQLSGTVTTQNKAYNNTPGKDYEVKLDAYRRADSQMITLEFSIDSGSTWNDVTLTKVPGPLDPSLPFIGFGFTGTIAGVNITGSGNIKFRVTMTRASANDPAPHFEIVRARRVLSEHSNPLILKQRPDYTHGNILLLRTFTSEQDSLDSSRGRLTDHLGDRSWTAPLDFFDTSLTHDTPACRITDYAGPHAFYEHVTGVQATNRYVMTKTNTSEQFGVFTYQDFDDRRVGNGEAYQLVW